VDSESVTFTALFVWLISHQSAVLFSRNKRVVNTFSLRTNQHPPPAKRTVCTFGPRPRASINPQELRVSSLGCLASKFGLIYYFLLHDAMHGHPCGPLAKHPTMKCMVVPAAVADRQRHLVVRPIAPPGCRPPSVCH
jgi:hypothetical protein